MIGRGVSAKRCGLIGDQVMQSLDARDDATADALLRFAGEPAIDVRPAGVSVAGYVAKVDGAGITAPSTSWSTPKSRSLRSGG